MYRNLIKMQIGKKYILSNVNTGKNKKVSYKLRKSCIFL